MLQLVRTSSRVVCMWEEKWRKHEENFFFLKKFPIYRKIVELPGYVGHVLFIIQRSIIDSPWFF